ncbi:MAG: glycosyltransferase [Nitrospirota bacterium]
MISSFVEVTEDMERAEIIHSINWHALMEIDRNILRNKVVVSHIPHDVRNMLMQPEYLRAAPFVDYWIVPSFRAKEYMEWLGLPNIYVPYGIDPGVFYKIKDDAVFKDFKMQYNIPADKYLIGSFQRDTEGSDLTTPKYMKGPDIFLEIVKKIYEKNKNIHIVLAGPRRFWLRRKLSESGIPFTFVGELIEGKDDLIENTIDRSLINILYNIINVYLVSSRMEGGPKAVLECASTQTKILSTDVGHAKDILEKKQIYGDILEAVDLILDDIENNSLKQYVSRNFAKSKQHHMDAIQPVLSDFYRHLKTGGKQGAQIFKEIKKAPVSFRDRLFGRRSDGKKISIYFRFQKPPWGGGNQFLLALTKMLVKKGWSVNHDLNRNSQVVLINSFHIEFDKIKRLNRSRALILHRIDGPTILVRGKDKELDDSIFKMNNEVADISVFQSLWSLIETLKLGYMPVNPLIIVNASDPDIFRPKETDVNMRGRKIKLISTSWSDNPRKGGPIYKWLDETLDWNRYEYTFVGRASEKFKNIKHVEPVPSEVLADILKQHDIFITASDNDPCSNALIEALSCGLPTIYRNRGGHPELVGAGGLGFEEREDIPILLERLIENYEAFRNLVVSPSMDRASSEFITCFGLRT